MTLPYEEVYALERTREFLRKLLDPKQTPRVPRAIRKEAGTCLRHYPWQSAIVSKWGKEATPDGWAEVNLGRADNE